MWGYLDFFGPGMRDVVGAWLVCLAIAAGGVGLTATAGVS